MSETLEKLDAITKAFVKKHKIEPEELEGSWERIPTGIPALDGVTGGGIPRGAVLEIFGEPGAGKSTLCYYIAGKFVEAGGIVIYLDIEGEVNSEWAAKNGLDFSSDSVKLLRFDYAEHVLSYIETVAGAMTPEDKALIIIDSIAALVPKDEAEQDIDKASIALAARLSARFVRRVKSKLSKSKTTLIAVNQVRATMNPFGPSEDTPGGISWKFVAAARFRVSRGSAFKEGDRVIGHTIKVYPVKNKLSFLNLTVQIPLYNTTGIDVAGAVFDDAVALGIISRAGSYYDIGSERLQGRDNAIAFLRSHPDIMKEMAQKVYTTLISGGGECE